MRHLPTIAFRHFYGKEFLLSTRQLQPAPTPSKKVP